MVRQTQENGKYVAYFRVSTKRQGESGLGLDAQRATVRQYLDQVRGVLIPGGEFEEVESGKRHENRPQLDAAMNLARATGATLLVAKLDRLSRDLEFLSRLSKEAAEGGLRFVACDVPHANQLTIHVLAAVAQHEREMISGRIKAALAVVKEQEKTGPRPGKKKLGPSPQAIAAIQQHGDRGRLLAVIAIQRQADAFARRLAPSGSSASVPTSRVARRSTVSIGTNWPASRSIKRNERLP